MIRGITFRHWPPKTYPRPSRDAAPQGVVWSLTRRLYAESHNVCGDMELGFLGSEVGSDVGSDIGSEVGSDPRWIALRMS